MCPFLSQVVDTKKKKRGGDGKESVKHKTASFQPEIYYKFC